jgi:hypothetical protein
VWFAERQIGLRLRSRRKGQGVLRPDVAEHFFEAVNTEDEDFAATAQARYNAAVERLTAEEWKRKWE